MVDIRASGLLTITFDDGLLCQYDNGYPLLSKNGIRAVAFVPTGLVGGSFGNEQSMSLSHLRELSAAGWEIGSHSVSHARLTYKDGQTRLPLSVVDAELRESKEWLVANGFSVISFAYPAGRYNDEVEAISQRYYSVLRTTKKGLNDVTSGSTRLKVFDLRQQVIDRWKLAVDEALWSKRWLIAMIHGVAQSADQIPLGRESLWIVRDELAECLQYALSSRLPILTLREVYDGSQKLAEGSRV